MFAAQDNNEDHIEHDYIDQLCIQLFMLLPHERLQVMA